jgi:SAM-dependent methyltransferase
VTKQDPNQKLDLARVYQFRFASLAPGKKSTTWTIITRWIEQKLGNPQVVLDPAAGQGEFILASRGTELWACDLSNQLKSWPKEITTHFGNIYDIALPQNYFDFIFISNFLEHLATPDDVFLFLKLMHRSLKPGGKIAIMGPNFRFCANEYFDFADHLLPLSDRTIEEHLAAVDLKCEEVISKFLPLSFRSQRISHPILVKIYLKLPILWRFFGKQFFIVATRPKIN